MKERQAVIEWTPEKLARLINVYDKAVESGATEFKFDGHDFVVGYAKYLIEYLTDKFCPWQK